MRHLIEVSPHRELLTVRAVEVVLIGVLDRLPDLLAQARSSSGMPPAELMAIVIERAIF